MNKFIKLFFVALFAALSFSLTSCGDDDDDEISSITGTWEGGNIRYADESLTITFNSNGTGNYKSYIDYGELDEDCNFKYKIEGEWLLLVTEDEYSYGDDYYSEYRYKISDKKLYIYDFMSENWVLNKK